MSADARRHRFTVAAGWMLMVVVAVLATPVWAEEADGEQAPRYLGEHLFMPSSLVPDPFIATDFTTTTGFGAAINLTSPVYNLHGDQIGQLTGEIGFMLLEFGYQQAIAGRYAVRGGLVASARLGTNTEAILAEGVSALYGYGVGGSARLLSGDSWQLTATADLRGNTLFTMSPIGFARAIVGSVLAGDTTGAVSAGKDTLLKDGDNLRVLAGLRGAYTPAPWIGFTALVEGGLGERFTQGADDLSVINLGATVGVDFNAVRGIPVGLLGVFRSESLTEREDDSGGSSQLYGLGILYTGRRFFSIGLENVWGQLNQKGTDTKVDVVTSRIVLRYDFN